MDKIELTKDELWKIFFKENVRGLSIFNFVMSSEYKLMRARFNYFWHKKLKERQEMKEDLKDNG